MKFRTARGTYSWPGDYLSRIDIVTDADGEYSASYIIPRAAGGDGTARADATIIERKGAGDITGHMLQHDPVWLLLQDWESATSSGSIEDVRALLSAIAVAAAWDHRKILSPNLNQITYALKNAADLLDVQEYLRTIERLEKELKRVQQLRQDSAVEESRARQNDDYLAVVKPKAPHERKK